MKSFFLTSSVLALLTSLIQVVSSIETANSRHVPAFIRGSAFDDDDSDFPQEQPQQLQEEESSRELWGYGQWSFTNLMFSMSVCRINPHCPTDHPPPCHGCCRGCPHCDYFDLSGTKSTSGLARYCAKVAAAAENNDDAYGYNQGNNNGNNNNNNNGNNDSSGTRGGNSGGEQYNGRDSQGQYYSGGESSRYDSSAADGESTRQGQYKRFDRNSMVKTTIKWTMAMGFLVTGAMMVAVSFFQHRNTVDDGSVVSSHELKGSVAKRVQSYNNNNNSKSMTDSFVSRVEQETEEDSFMSRTTTTFISLNADPIDDVSSAVASEQSVETRARPALLASATTAPPTTYAI